MYLDRPAHQCAVADQLEICQVRILPGCAKQRHIYHFKNDAVVDSDHIEGGNRGKNRSQVDKSEKDLLLDWEPVEVFRVRGEALFSHIAKEPEFVEEHESVIDHMLW